MSSVIGLDPDVAPVESSFHEESPQWPDELLDPTDHRNNVTAIPEVLGYGFHNALNLQLVRSDDRDIVNVCMAARKRGELFLVKEFAF